MVIGGMKCSEKYIPWMEHPAHSEFNKVNVEAPVGAITVGKQGSPLTQGLYVLDTFEETVC